MDWDFRVPTTERLTLVPFSLNSRRLGSGTLNNIPFDGIEKLTGGAGNDQFVIAASGDLAGIINGGGGLDTMDLTALTGPRTIDLGPKTISGLLATFASIQTIRMPSGVLNTLVGPNTNSAWSINGVNQVTVAGVQLIGVGNIRGSDLKAGPATMSSRWE